MRIDPNIQALDALSQSMTATANNIANFQTPGFHATHAQLESGEADQGVRIAQWRRDEAQGPLVYQDGEIHAQANTDLVHETVDLIITEKAYAANLVAIRAADELQGLLIDRMV